MSYNQGHYYSQGQYSHYNQNAHRTPYQQGQSSSSLQAGQNAPLRRIPSFDPGDDSAQTDPRSSSGQYYEGYENANNELHLNPQSPSYLHRSTSHGSPTSSNYYPQSGTAPAPPPGQSYNPQHYGAPQSHPSPPQPGAPFNATFNSNYQTYNPAAYHQAVQHNQAAYNANHPPPPPPRPYGNSISSRVSPPSASSAHFAHSGSSLPYRPAQPTVPGPSQSTSSYQTYTPPAPPAPPFSPGRDAFPPHTPSSASSQQQASSASPSAYRQSSSASSPYLHNQTLTDEQPYSPANIRMPSPSIHRRPVGGSNNGPLPPTPETPGPTPPAHSPQRNNTVGRHPQSRPLPDAPSADDGYFRHHEAENEANDDQKGYDDLMQEVEAAVMGRPPPSRTRRSESDSRPLPQPTRQDMRSSQISSQHSSLYGQVNGNIGQMGEGQYVNYDAYSDDSDAEAEAGLAAMRSAEEQEAADLARQHSQEQSRRSQDSHRTTPRDRPSPGISENGVPMDMSTYGGDFPGGYHYGDEATSNERSSPSTSMNHAFAEDRTSRRSDSSAFTLPVGTETYDYPLYQHSFAPARVDTGGTGGLSEPSARPRRHSFEDGDEATLVDTESSYPSRTPSPSKEGMPDMFFHPGPRSGRPLPAAPVDQSVPQLMPAGTYKDPEKLLQYDEHGRLRYPMAPDAYSQSLTPGGTPVPRSSSLISRGSQPQTAPPLRSKTDADRQRIMSQQQQSGYRSASSYTPDAFADSTAYPSAELDLPSIPLAKRRKFNPAKLSSNEFKKCLEPWALSSVVAWLKEMTEGEADLKEGAVVEGIVALFTHKVPTMNTADAEALGAKAVRAMFDSGTLVKDEEWVKFGTEEMSGVFYQLTGTGCYSSRVHSEPLPGRCYSHHCMRTLKKINLQTQVLEPQRKQEDWFTFYKLKKQDLEKADKKDVERQNNLHEIVTTEDNYIDQLNVLRVLYRDELARAQPPIVAPQRKENFMKDVFGNVDVIKQVNEDHLLAQLKYRQQEEGPWIIGFSDVFREWIRKARTAYIDYAASFPNAVFLIKQEARRNLLFKQFLDQMQENERSKRLDWNTYLKAPITRLQRYGLLLSTVHKHMSRDSEEKRNLSIAMEEIKKVTLECDAKVEEMSKHVDLAMLNSKMKLRTGMDQTLLNLTHLGREIVFQGDLQRLGSTKLTWVDAHAILFDHYFVLAKVIEEKHPTGGEKGEKYDVNKAPIPMDLLVLESTNDDPVNKSKMGTVTAVAPRGGIPSDTRTGRQSLPNGTTGPGTLGHVDSASSVNSAKTLIPSTNLDNLKAENLIWPFKIRHLGRNDSFALYAPTKAARQEWCMKILEAKTRHAASLYKQNAEPFRLRVIADTAFAYDGMIASSKSTPIRGTPLDRAIREVEKTFESSPRANPICRATVNCATTFNHTNGIKMLAIGSDYGVYMTDTTNPRGWSRIIAAQRVTQIAVLEDFSLMLILTEKTLVAHHLDTVLSSHTSTNTASASSQQHAPQKLSGARDIGFFAHGRMKDRQLIFYKKREGVTSVFKVLEPIYQRTASIGSASSTSSMRSRLMGGMRSLAKAGTTESFRDFDDFYIGSDTYAINLFHSSLAIATARGGIEVMTLDKKTPISVPDLKAPDVAIIASRIRDMKPLGMFRLSDSEFLLAYEEVGVYVNKHGDVSRSVIMEYVGRAKQACLVGAMYLILVDYYGLYVEVRNAINGRLRQVISGKDVRLLDDGGPPNQNYRASGAPGTPTMGAFGSPGTVKICMQHPEWERNQIVLELIVNEGLKE